MGLNTLTESVERLAELLERATAVAVVGVARSFEGGAQGEGRHGECSALRGGITSVHVLHGTRCGLRARGIEVDFEVLHRLDGHAQLQVLGLVARGGSCHRVGDEKPSVLACPLDERVASHTEREVESGSHHTGGTRLTEQVAHGGHEARQRHRILVAIGEADIANRHEQSGNGLRGLVPTLVVERVLGRDGDFQLEGGVDLVLDEDLVVVQLLELQLELLALGGLRHHTQAFRLLSVVDLDGGVGEQGDFLLETLLVLRQFLLLLLHLLVVGTLTIGGCLLAIGGSLLTGLFLFLLLLLGVGLLLLFLVDLRLRRLLVESLVGLLQERNVVVELLEAEGAVEVERAVVGDGVTQRCAVFELGSTNPVVGGVVGGIGCHPIEDGDEVERQLVAGLERLVVVERRTERADALLDGVFPSGVLVGIEVAVDGRVGFLDLGVGGTLEVHVEVLREVPAQREIAVPQELLAEGQRQSASAATAHRDGLHVALLQLVVVAEDVGVEGDALRQPVESESLEDVVVFRLALDVLERLERLENGRPVVAHGTLPVIFVLIDGRLTRRVAMGVAVGEREVGRIDRRGMAFVLNAHTHVGEREVGVGGLAHGDALNGVALVLVLGSIEGVAESHIRVEWVVLGSFLVLRQRIIERSGNLRLVGEELSKLKAGCDRIRLEIVVGTRGDTLLETSEALRGVATLHVHGSEVGQLHVEVSLCSPSTFVVVFLQAQLVHPNLTALLLSTEVAHADNHRLHLAQRGISHDADLVLRTVLVVHREDAIVGRRSLRLRHVALFLDLREELERDVEHVLLGPHGSAVGNRIAVVVVAGSGELQRNLVFVVVALVVASQTDEDSELVVGEVGGVLLECVGMYEHLDAFVLAHVDGRVLIDGFSLTIRQVRDHHIERLLVALDELRLGGVGIATYSGRQHIVHGKLVVVLLDVDGADRETSRLRSRVVDVLLVDAPLAIHQLERSESEHDGMLEAREEHAHEADGGEVVDGTHAALVVVDGDAELIPGNMVGETVSKGRLRLAFVDNVVLADHKVLRTQGDMILVVFLVLVERVVLVDVLDVGRSLIGSVVALGAALGVGGVALRVVDVFVSTQDAGLNLVVVASTEIVVVVVGRVVHDGVEHSRRDLPLDGREEVLIGLEGSLLFVVQTVETEVLAFTTAAGGGESVVLGGLDGNLSPMCEGEVLGAIHRHSTLVELLSVAQDVFAYLTQVDVEVATIFGGVVRSVGVDEGVHHPELDVLHVGGLEVVGVEFSHHTTPVLRRVVECSVLRKVGIEVVRSTLVGIIGKIEHR